MKLWTKSLIGAVSVGAITTASILGIQASYKNHQAKKHGGFGQYETFIDRRVELANTYFASPFKNSENIKSIDAKELFTSKDDSELIKFSSNYLKDNSVQPAMVIEVGGTKFVNELPNYIHPVTFQKYVSWFLNSGEWGPEMSALDNITLSSKASASNALGAFENDVNRPNITYNIGQFFGTLNLVNRSDFGNLGLLDLYSQKPSLMYKLNNKPISASEVQTIIDGINKANANPNNAPSQLKIYSIETAGRSIENGEELFNVLLDSSSGILDKITETIPGVATNVAPFQYKMVNGQYVKEPGKRISSYSTSITMLDVINAFGKIPDGITLNFLKYTTMHEYGHHQTSVAGMADKSQSPSIFEDTDQRTMFSSENWKNLDTLNNYLAATAPRLRAIRMNQSLETTTDVNADPSEWPFAAMQIGSNWNASKNDYDNWRTITAKEVFGLDDSLMNLDNSADINNVLARVRYLTKADATKAGKPVTESFENYAEKNNISIREVLLIAEFDVWNTTSVLRDTTLPYNLLYIDPADSSNNRLIERFTSNGTNVFDSVDNNLIGFYSYLKDKNGAPIFKTDKNDLIQAKYHEGSIYEFDTTANNLVENTRPFLRGMTQKLRGVIHSGVGMPADGSTTYIPAFNKDAVNETGEKIYSDEVINSFIESNGKGGFILKDLENLSASHPDSTHGLVLDALISEISYDGTFDFPSGSKNFANTFSNFITNKVFATKAEFKAWMDKNIDSILFSYIANKGNKVGGSYIDSPFSSKPNNGAGAYKRGHTPNLNTLGNEANIKWNNVGNPFAYRMSLSELLTRDYNQILFQKEFVDENLVGDQSYSEWLPELDTNNPLTNWWSLNTDQLISSIIDSIKDERKNKEFKNIGDIFRETAQYIESKDPNLASNIFIGSNVTSASYMSPLLNGPVMTNVYTSMDLGTSNVQSVMQDTDERFELGSNLYDRDMTPHQIDPNKDGNLRIIDPYTQSTATDRVRAFWAFNLLEKGMTGNLANDRTVSGIWHSTDKDAYYIWGYIKTNVPTSPNGVQAPAGNGTSDIIDKDKVKFLTFESSNGNKINLPVHFNDNLYYNERQYDGTSERKLEEEGYTGWSVDYTTMGTYDDATIASGEYKIYFTDEQGNRVNKTNGESLFSLGNSREKVSTNDMYWQVAPVYLTKQTDSSVKVNIKDYFQ